MAKVEVYFDYMCPFCYKGHKMLKTLLVNHPETEIVWRPIEAHPRPEVYDIYSDIAMMGMYFLRDNGGDTDKYNDLVFEAHFEKKVRIDSPDVLTAIAAECGADTDAFRAAITDGRYADDVLRENDYAWDVKGWEAVPSYSCDGDDLGSRGGVLVSAEALDKFLSR